MFEINIQNRNIVTTSLPLDAVVAEVVAALVAGEPVLASVHHEPPVLGTALTVQFSTVQYCTVQYNIQRLLPALCPNR